MGLRPTNGDEDAENQNHRSLTLAARNEASGRYRTATVRESVPLADSGRAPSRERYHETCRNAPLWSRFGYYGAGNFDSRDTFPCSASRSDT
jgi:hypothetical protein